MKEARKISLKLRVSEFKNLGKIFIEEKCLMKTEKIEICGCFCAQDNVGLYESLWGERFVTLGNNKSSFSQLSLEEFILTQTLVVPSAVVF